MKNTVFDLNDHLFEQLERLKDAKGNKLKKEMERTKSMVSIAKPIIENARVVLEAAKQTSEGHFNNKPKMFEPADRLLIGQEK